MTDEFAGTRLPDLPNAGYSTDREKKLSDLMMFAIRGWERERPILLMMVIEGYEKFRGIMLKEWKAWKVDEDEIKTVYDYLVTLAGPDPQGQLARLMKIRPGVPQHG